MKTRAGQGVVIFSGLAVLAGLLLLFLVRRPATNLGPGTPGGSTARPQIHTPERTPGETAGVPVPRTTGPDSAGEGPGSPLERLFEELYADVLRSVEDRGEIAQLARDEKLRDFVTRNPSASDLIIARIKSLGSLFDPVSVRLLKAIVGVVPDQTISALREQVGEGPPRPRSLDDALRLLSLARGAGTRGEKAISLGKLLDSPFAHDPRVWPEIRALASSAPEPWIRSQIMTQLVFLNQPASIRDLCEHIAAAQRDDPVGVGMARSLLIRNYFEYQVGHAQAGRSIGDNDLGDRLVETVLRDFRSSLDRGATFDQASIFLNTLNACHDPKAERTLAHLSPIVTGAYPLEIRAAAVSALAPRWLGRLATSDPRVADYRRLVLPYAASVYSRRLESDMKMAIFEVFGLLGEKQHVVQLEQLRTQDPEASEWIQQAIEQIEDRMSGK